MEDVVCLQTARALRDALRAPQGRGLVPVLGLETVSFEPPLSLGPQYEGFSKPRQAWYDKCVDLKSRLRRALAERQKVRFSIEGYTEAAVLVPIFKGPEGYHVLFTKRTEALEKHKGQISFPGGARHGEDGSLLDTALRESWEEIGLRPEDVEVLGELDEMRTPTTFYHISPFVGMIPHPYEFKINRDEVEEIIEAPLSALRDPQIYWEEEKVYAGKTWPVSHFRYGDRVIWGATARMLKDLLVLVFGDAPPMSTSQYRTD